MVVLADFPDIGIYLLMLKSVAKILIAYFGLLSFIIVAFSLGFHILIRDTGHSDPFSSFIATLGEL